MSIAAIALMFLVLWCLSSGNTAAASVIAGIAFYVFAGMWVWRLFT